MSKMYRSELKIVSDGMQVYDVYKYWTEQGTARLDPIIIFT